MNLYKPTKTNLYPVTNNEGNYLKSEKANQYPIENLYKGELKGTKTKMGKCPFHQEENASFAIYPHTNSWNCFAGCGGGDVISFYMKLHAVDFQTAVTALNEL